MEKHSLFHRTTASNSLESGLGGGGVGHSSIAASGDARPDCQMDAGSFAETGVAVYCGKGDVVCDGGGGICGDETDCDVPDESQVKASCSKSWQLLPSSYISSAYTLNVLRPWPFLPDPLSSSLRNVVLKVLEEKDHKYASHDPIHNDRSNDHHDANDQDIGDSKSEDILEGSCLCGRPFIPLGTKSACPQTSLCPSQSKNHLDIFILYGTVSGGTKQEAERFASELHDEINKLWMTDGIFLHCCPSFWDVKEGMKGQNGGKMMTNRKAQRQFSSSSTPMIASNGSASYIPASGDHQDQKMSSIQIRIAVHSFSDFSFEGLLSHLAMKEMDKRDKNVYDYSCDGHALKKNRNVSECGKGTTKRESGDGGTVEHCYPFSTLLFLFLATDQGGMPPKDAIVFFNDAVEAVDDFRVSKASLRSAKFSTVGFGSSAYGKNLFCLPACRLTANLSRLGARSFLSNSTSSRIGCKRVKGGGGGGVLCVCDTTEIDPQTSEWKKAITQKLQSLLSSMSGRKDRPTDEEGRTNAVHQGHSSPIPLTLSAAKSSTCCSTPGSHLRPDDTDTLDEKAACCREVIAEVTELKEITKKSDDEFGGIDTVSDFHEGREGGREEGDCNDDEGDCSSDDESHEDESNDGDDSSETDDEGAEDGESEDDESEAKLKAFGTCGSSSGEIEDVEEMMEIPDESFGSGESPRIHLDVSRVGTGQRVEDNEAGGQPLASSPHKSESGDELSYVVGGKTTKRMMRMPRPPGQASSSPPPAASSSPSSAGMEDGNDALPSMISKRFSQQLEKEGYKLIGSHSAVKLCRWTKAQLRGRGGCYKHTLYGIVSYQCMELTPSLACANKCIFCWRHHKNPVGKKWQWKQESPFFIVEDGIDKHRKMIKELRGLPGLVSRRFDDAWTVKHCALSLVGEPIMYPRINELVDDLHRREISSFLVTNAQFPRAMRNLVPVTQLYISVDAADADSLKKIDRPLFSDFWKRFLECIDIIKEKKCQRTVYRLTLVQGFNMDDASAYAELVQRGKPDFVEIKGVTYCGVSKGSPLTIKNTPWHDDVVNFATALCKSLAAVDEEYAVASEHQHTCCVLVSRKEYMIDGVWHTWIDYPRFFELARRYKNEGIGFTPLDFCAPTPTWALIGAPERGFDPAETRTYTKGKHKRALREKMDPVTLEEREKEEGEVSIPPMSSQADNKPPAAHTYNTMSSPLRS